jgi:hypothetical protein
MAAYYKVDVVLNSQAVQVGLPSPQSVRVTLPLRGPQGLQGLQGEVGPIGPVGETGSPGADGREVELQTTESHVQWRYEGESEWTDLVALSAITGPQGIQGETGLTGAAGADGREVELRKTETHVQWRYEDEAEYTDLIALSEITGPQGQTGNQGPAGPANTLAIGTVTTGAAGSSADATLTGDSPAQTLNLVIPRGDKGDQGDQGPPGTATTDAADLTTGTLADARLSTNVPLLDAANTFSANQTFSGTNNVMPNQTTAASGSSIMTRDLVDNEFLRRVNKYSEHEIYTFTTAMLSTLGGDASANNVTGGSEAPAWLYRPNNTADGARNYQTLIGARLQLSNGSDRDKKNWSKRSAISMRTYLLSGSNSGTSRYYWGPQASTWTGGALAVRGIGFEVVNNVVFATCHDGTTKTTAATGVTLSFIKFISLHIESDGSGGVRWWVDGVEQTALTGGPTGSSNANEFGFCTEAVNPTPAVSTFVNVQYLRLASVN